MRRIRPMVLLLLMLTVPFQAAVGAGGMLCSAKMQHGPAGHAEAHEHAPTVSSTDSHHTGMGNSGHHAEASGVSHVSQEAAGHHGEAPQPDNPNAVDPSGKCKTCNECSSPAAPVLLTAGPMIPPDTPLRVSTLVDPDFVSRTGDGLFRPPRSPGV